MSRIQPYIEDQLVRGRAYFTREEAQAALALSSSALGVALLRQVKKGRLANPWRGFYLILRPEDRVFGAPDPARWIDPLMRFLGLDYRVALLSAAAFHGASHQAAMAFQVIVPKQLRGFEIGRHRLQFVYQTPAIFGAVNQGGWLATIKTDTGFAKIAGLELTLFDCARYFHKAGSVNGLAQIAKDIGGQARPDELAAIAAHYENATVRRLGYLLERAGHHAQALALMPFVRKAKTSAPLNPAAKPLPEGMIGNCERAPSWQLIINEPVEIDF